MPYDIPNDQEKARLKQVLGQVPAFFLLVRVLDQQLYVIQCAKTIKQYSVSTAKNGIGNKEGSLMTPSGVHQVVEKFGHGAPLSQVFVDREDTGQTWKVGEPGENLILTRILWLAGLEVGINQGPGIDSFERYIYIHGTSNEPQVGTPMSHGCVVMKNADVVELFDMTPEGTIVFISEG